MDKPEKKANEEWYKPETKANEEWANQRQKQMWNGQVRDKGK